MSQVLDTLFSSHHVLAADLSGLWKRQFIVRGRSRSNIRVCPSLVYRLALPLGLTFIFHSCSLRTGTLGYGRDCSMSDRSVKSSSGEKGARVSRAILSSFVAPIGAYRPDISASLRLPRRPRRMVHSASPRIPGTSRRPMPSRPSPETRRPCPAFIVAQRQPFFEAPGPLEQWRRARKSLTRQGLKCGAKPGKVWRHGAGCASRIWRRRGPAGPC